MKSLLTIAALFFTTHGFSQSATEKEILAISNLKFHYMTAGKIDSLANVFDDKMLLQHGNGMIQTKAEYLDNLKSGMLKYNAVDIKDAKATVVGATAFVLGNCRFHVTFNGKEMEFDFGYTEVYALQNNKWKMALYAVRKVDSKEQ
jgi:hypothetical protein